MGLFDGTIDAAATGAVAEGSTAQVAALLGAPVVLVVDARGQSQSLAAVLHGFSTFDPAVRIGGVILNRVGARGTNRCCGRHASASECRCSAPCPRDDRTGGPVTSLGLIPASSTVGRRDRPSTR